jgi:hypothetical protein
MNGGNEVAFGGFPRDTKPPQHCRASLLRSKVARGNDGNIAALHCRAALPQNRKKLNSAAMLRYKTNERGAESEKLVQLFPPKK